MRTLTPLQIRQSAGNHKFIIGFTLVELMVVVAIVTIVMGAVYATLTIGRQSWYTAQAKIEMRQETRKAMDLMVKELRQSGLDYSPKYPGEVIALALDTNQNTITFRISQGWDSVNQRIDWGNQITYSLNGKQLFGNSTVLANNITSLQFRRTSTTPDIIEISIIAQKDILHGRRLQSTLDSQVMLRN